MPDINGIFICLHTCNPLFSPYYNSLKYTGKLCLADCFNGGNPPYSDSYEITDEETLKEKLDGVNPVGKLFFTESNSAHHISGFLAERTFDELFKAEKISSGNKYLVLNFDQHEDYGTPDSKLFCGSWGSHISNKINCDYMIVGRKTKCDAYLRKSDGSTQIIALDNPDELQRIYAEYDKIYVTVDMDVLSGVNGVMRTNWKHGDMELSTLTLLLNELPKDKISSADITGFPPNCARNPEELEGYVEDILTVAKTLNSLI